MLYYIKVNLPETENDYKDGNGECVWALVDDTCKKAYDNDSDGCTFIGILCNGSIYYPHLAHGMAVVIEMRGEKRPVVPLGFLTNYVEYLRSVIND